MQEYDDERSRECDAREHTTHAGPRTMSRGTRRVNCISYRRVRNTGRAKAFLHSWHDTHSRTRGPGYNTATEPIEWNSRARGRGSCSLCCCWPRVSAACCERHLCH